MIADTVHLGCLLAPESLRNNAKQTNKSQIKRKGKYRSGRTESSTYSQPLSHRPAQVLPEQPFTPQAWGPGPDRESQQDRQGLGSKISRWTVLERIPTPLPKVAPFPSQDSVISSALCVRPLPAHLQMRKSPETRSIWWWPF